MNKKLQQYVQLAAVAIVIVACYQILQAFIPALLFSAVACSSSWPLFTRLRRWLGGRSGWAALAMTLLLVVLVIGPGTVIVFSLADDVTLAAEAIKSLLERGPILPPAWLKAIPLIGDPLNAYWHRLAVNRAELTTLVSNLFEPAKNFVLDAGKAVGASLMQMTFATFIVFFLYRDGESLMEAFRKVLERLAGTHGEELLVTIDNTVTGVVHGIFGTALAQTVIAVIGFVIAGVPAALVLGAATFFLSMIPIGPPLVWGGAAAWLFYQGDIGWAVFMLAWGLLAISSIDNFVRPYLISRSSSLPLLLIVFGVFGGILTFGFIGIFIGPPVLAVGLSLVQLWTSQAAVLDNTRS